MPDRAAVHTVSLPGGYSISDDPARIDMAYVHLCLAGTYWGAGRPRHLSERSWANCLGFGLFAPEGRQIGFARVLTDYTFRAHLGDVFIHADARGRGLGEALIQTVLSHPDLATVTSWTLQTADAHGLYERHGFRLAEANGRWMTLDRPPPP